MRTFARAVVLAGVAGCGRLGFDAQPVDNGPPDGGAPDAAGALFSTPEPVTELNEGGAHDPTLTGDLLEIFFVSSRLDGAGDTDIWTARRSAPTAPWDPPTPVTELNTASQDVTPRLSHDGLTMLLASDRPGTTGGLDLYLATRSTLGDSWSTPVPVGELNTPDSEYSGATDETATSLVFVRSPMGVASSHLLVTRRASAGDPWPAPAPVDELNAGGLDGAPFLTADGLTLYWSSDRGAGAARDLFVASRPALDAPFGAAAALSELSSTADEIGQWHSPDARVIFFDSARDGPRQLYSAVRED